MNNLKRILALGLAILLTASLPVFAETVDIKELNDRFLSDIDNIDRVYEYDLVEKKVGEVEEVESGEVIKNTAAVQLVTSLGIMSYLPDGSFSEDKNVPFNEFSQIVYLLGVGQSEDVKQLYSEYGETHSTTMAEVAYYLVEALGYHVYESRYKSEQPRIDIAHSIDLFDGVSFYGEKLITRGELAKVISNALDIDLVKQTIFGTNEEYSIEKGTTLLSERFSAVKIEGLLTAVPGVNIYSMDKPNENEIQIDRVRYRAKDFGAVNLLGHRVLAVMIVDENLYEHIISIEPSEKDTTLRVPFSNIVELNESSLTYMDGSNEKRVSLKGIQKVTRNGVSTNDKTLLSTSLLRYSGELVLCTSVKNGTYDIAMVELFEDFVIRSVSILDERIYFEYGQKLNAQDYIDTSERSNIFLNITKDGQSISYEQIKAGDVVTIMASSDFSVVNMIVSDNKVTGKITSKSNNDLVIDGKNYTISEAYFKASQVDTSLPELQVGVTGTYYCSYDNRIVGYRSSVSAHRYGYMTKIGQFGSALDKKVAVRIFNDAGEWNDYPLARKLTLDGELMKSEDAYQLIGTATIEVLDAVVRFDVNDDDEVTFLDTARTKILGPGELDPEAYDPGRVIKAAEWSGTFNWQTEGVLTSSKYLVSPEATVFSIPKDKEAEDMYTVTKKRKFTQDTSSTLTLYSPDEFNMVPVMVESVVSEAISYYTQSYFVVAGISEAVNKKGEPVHAISCLAFDNTAWKMKTFYSTSQMHDQGLGMHPGDLVCYTAIGNEIQNYTVRVETENRETDTSYLLFSYPSFAYGTIVDIDAERSLIKFRVNQEECVFKCTQLGLYLTEKQKGYDAVVGDVRVGDKIFTFGAHKTFVGVVLR